MTICEQWYRNYHSTTHKIPKLEITQMSTKSRRASKSTMGCARNVTPWHWTVREHGSTIYDNTDGTYNCHVEHNDQTATSTRCKCLYIKARRRQDSLVMVGLRKIVVLEKEGWGRREHYNGLWSADDVFILEFALVLMFTKCAELYTCDVYTFWYVCTHR